jgi:glycosyltransferase involved in cell wall biosynthesis
MNYAPLISIISIVFNDARGLAKTMASVLEQDYANKEYIIIDGGSQDGTVELIKEHETQLSNWVSEKDKGISDAFNKGVKAARGEWIVLLNAADYFQDPHVLSRMLPHLEQNRAADIVYAKLREVDADGHKGKSFGKAFSRRSFERECTIIHPATFHRASFFEKNGLFSLDFKIAMDYELFLRKKDLHAVFVDEEITFMETGGASQQDPSPAYKEANKAKRMHLNKSEVQLKLEYYENMLRYRLSKLKQRFL